VRVVDVVLEARWFDAAKALRQVTAREHEALADALADVPRVVYGAYE
jgi:hypothetical protein